MKPLVLFGHSRPVTQVLFNREGDLLFTSGKDSNMNVFDAVKGELLGSYEGHKGAVNTFDVSEDSEWLVTGSADQHLRIFKALTGELALEHKFGAVLRSVEWAKTGGGRGLQLVVANDKWSSGDKLPAAITVFSFDVESKSLAVSMKISDALPMKAMAVKWGPFDDTVVSVHEEGTLFVWNSITGEKISEIQAHSRAITKLQFSVDRKLCITASADMSAKLWETATWTMVREYISDRPLNDAAISPIYRASERRREHLILAGGQEARDVTTTTAQEGKFESLLYHLVLEHELGKIKGHFGPLHTVAWAPNGLSFATGSEDGFVRLHMLDSDYINSRKWE